MRYDKNPSAESTLLQELLSKQVTVGLTLQEDRTVIGADPAFAGQLGYSAGELLSLRLEDLLFPEDREGVSVLFLTLEGEELPCRFLCRNGEERSFRIRLVRHEDHILLLCRKPGEEDRYITAQKIRIYEIRKTLAEVSSLQEILLHRLQEQNVSAQAVRLLARCRSSLSGVFLELSHLSREVEAPIDLKPCSLGAMLSGLADALQERLGKRGCTVTFENRCLGETTALCDRLRLQQILLPIVLRSVERMGEKDCLTFTLREQGAMLYIEISDHAEPVPGELLPFLFKESGFPTAQESLRSMGGSIRGENLPGSGTRFTITLPRYRTVPNRLSGYRELYGDQEAEWRHSWSLLLSEAMG